MYKDSDFKSFYHIKEKNKKNSVLSALFVVKSSCDFNLRVDFGVGL